MLPEVNERDVSSFNIHGGQLVLIAGRPSMGKTTFMLNQIKYLCGEKGKNVLMFSLDESKERIAEQK